MNVSGKETRSELSQAALALDTELSQLHRLSGEIARLEIESDQGLERARLLLSRFGETGQRIGDGVQILAKALDEARARAEVAAQAVSARAEQVQRRQEIATRLLERFKALGAVAGKISSLVLELQKSGGREQLVSQLPELNSKLGLLIDEGVSLKNDALSANLKKLAGEADSVAQSLRSARQRLNSVAEDL